MSLAQFAAVAAGLWGGGTAWRDLVRSRHAAEADAALSLMPSPAALAKGAAPSLALYAAQALLPLCLVTDAASRGTWLALCDEIGWSRSQIPLPPLAEAAARAVASAPPSLVGTASAEDATLALRLMILAKGFNHLHAIMERVRGAAAQAQTQGQASGAAAVGTVDDAVFARLVSFAVADLRLQDTRDEQWQRTVAFLHDYLLTASEGAFNSLEEFVWAATDAHVLAVRAVLELYRGAGCPPLTDDDGMNTTAPAVGAAEDAQSDARHALQACVVAAMSWVAAQRAGLAAMAEKHSLTPPKHPLVDTALGQSLLAALPSLATK